MEVAGVGATFDAGPPGIIVTIDDELAGTTSFCCCAPAELGQVTEMKGDHELVIADHHCQNTLYECIGAGDW